MHRKMLASYILQSLSLFPLAHAQTDRQPPTDKNLDLFVKFFSMFVRFCSNCFHNLPTRYQKHTNTYILNLVQQKNKCVTLWCP